MHIGGLADDIRPFENILPWHRLIHFHMVVECCVANKLTEKIAMERVGEKWRQVLFSPCTCIRSSVVCMMERSELIADPGGKISRVSQVVIEDRIAAANLLLFVL